MINFKEATAKNFLSCGNVVTVFDLLRNKSTLIIGKNGQGKSLLVDLICFALYGKPYRNINKPQLVNSINQKGCIVTIKFSVGPDEYLVKRGIKPAIFEIYKNDKLVDQEAAVKDYQGYLESVILKINFKTFCQVVVMGSAAFTPFMQLTAAARRDVIEDVLDISIFSTMNDLLKTRIGDTKEEMKAVENHLIMAKKETESQKKLINVLSENIENRVAHEEAEILRKHREKNSLQEQIELFNFEISSLTTEMLDFDDAHYMKLVREQSKVEHDIEKENSILKKLSSMTDCPHCLQGVDHDHKDFIKNKIEDKTTRLSVTLNNLNSEIEKLETIKDKNSDITKKISTLSASVKTKQTQINSLDREMELHDKNIREIQSNSGDIKNEKNKLKEITDRAMNALKQRSTLLEVKNIQEISQLLLKDSGIKAAIIKEYVPIINKLVNRYLSIFGFDVNFILDENFNETIHSRGRDEFSYNSFSEGEKRRIDVAILFAFRQVTELKNSANCNLLIMDEIVDSSLDLNSREAFLEILNSEKGNTFVISHTAPSYDAFDAVIKAEKVGDFSTYEYVS